MIELFECLLYNQLQKYINREITVAVGEELITGVVATVNKDFIILIERTNGYERETRRRLIILNQISYIQVAV